MTNSDLAEYLEEGMTLAIHYARRAKLCGNAPYGSVILDRFGKQLGIGWGSGTDCLPLRHSEIKAIEAACLERGGLLYGCTLFQTHEPCMLCCGAINHSKISRVIYGTSRADFPHLFRQSTLSLEDKLRDTTHPAAIHKVLGGPILDECYNLLAKTATGQALKTPSPLP